MTTPISPFIFSFAALALAFSLITISPQPASERALYGATATADRNG